VTAVRHRLLRRRERSLLEDERWAQTMLGYAYGSRRQIDVIPVPFKETGPLAVEAGGGPSEQVFDRVEFTG
jgi:hypothetical protein